MEKETITIPGAAVACARCMAIIVNGFKPLDGINGISADKKANILMISYSSDIIDEDIIRARLRTLGFSREELYCLC